ncbi:MAG: hydroxymethylbilane synthase [Gaiellales bacterium]
MGSRASRLAVAQARLVAERLPESRLVTVSTAGDRDRERRFDQIDGGRGVFTGDLERALLEGEVDVAVHSAKDLTDGLPDGLVIAAVPPRGDPRDACCGPFAALEEIPAGARIGTSSARRAGLLHALRPDLEVVPLRGNVETRLAKLDSGAAEAIILAAAGLDRLGLSHRIGFHLDPALFVPEAGQGALAVQVRAGEETLVSELDDPLSHAELDAERAKVAELGGGCTVPVAAHAWHEDGRLRLRSWVGT